ncbi:MAG: DegT/DnrJ/EryC1/StrS family aminotransferase [Pseudomonadota bacterium]
MNSQSRPPVKVRFRDLSVADGPFRTKLVGTFERVLSHGQLIMGKEVEEFERVVAQYCGTKHSIGVASGTSAIYLALKALGVGPGDEVITTPMSWIATLNSICATGATPVFADVCQNLNIDPEAIRGVITPKTRAIVPVHYTGRLCDMDAILAIAREHNLLVMEDAAQALGATLPDGRRAGGFGHAGAFSLNPMKVLYGFGDAGAITTNDAEAIEKIEAYRYLGTVNRETCIDRELNHKIDSLQAALLLDSFSVLDETLDKRRQVAAKYSTALKDVVDCPEIPAEGDRRAIFFDYTLAADNRDQLLAHMESEGIECKIRHPILMPDQPAYADLPRPHVPVARNLVGRILTLPCHEKLSADQVDLVIDKVRSFYRSH